MTQVLSGKITVATGGIAVRGPDVPGRIFDIAALQGNTGLAYVGNMGGNNAETGKPTGDVTSATGRELAAGQSVRVSVQNLSGLYFDVATGGEGFSWIRIL
jgi:hypothetical protein